MKHTKKHSSPSVRNQWQPAYPNAAEPGYFTGKALEILAACVSSLGVVSAMMFLLILT